MAKKRKPTRPTPPTAARAPMPPVLSAALAAGARAPMAGTRAASLRPLVVDERLAIAVVGIAAAIAGLWAISGVLVPLLFVGVGTFLGAPSVAALQRRGVPRAVGAGLVIAAVILLMTGLAALVLPALVVDLIDLVSRAPELLLALAVKLESLTGITIPKSVKDISGSAASELVARLSPLARSGGALMGQGALGIARGAASALGVVAQILLVPVITFFMLTELPAVKSIVWRLWPRRSRAVVARYAPLANQALSGLVRGQLIVAAIMAGVYAIGLQISGVPSSLAIAVLAGAAYFIPFASGTVCLFLAVAFSLLELGGAAVGPVFGAVITAVVVQLLEGYVLTPRIVGEKAGLSPLATLLAVLCGGSAAGFLGVLFALPTGAVIALVVRDIAANRHPPSVDGPVSAQPKVSP